MTRLPTLDDMRRDVAELLGVDPAEIGDDDNLLDHGLDSMRLMQLASTWRTAGSPLDFSVLAEHPQLSYWQTLLVPPDGAA